MAQQDGVLSVVQGDGMPAGLNPGHTPRAAASSSARTNAKTSREAEGGWPAACGDFATSATPLMASMTPAHVRAAAVSRARTGASDASRPAPADSPAAILEAVAEFLRNHDRKAGDPRPEGRRELAVHPRAGLGVHGKHRARVEALEEIPVLLPVLDALVRHPEYEDEIKAAAYFCR